MLLVLSNKTKGLFSHFLNPSKIFSTNLAICCSTEIYFFQAYERLHYERSRPELKFEVIKMRNLSKHKRHIHLRLILNTLNVKGHHTYVALSAKLRGKENISYFLKQYQSHRQSPPLTPFALWHHSVSPQKKLLVTEPITSGNRFPDMFKSKNSSNWVQTIDDQSLPTRFNSANETTLSSFCHSVNVLMQFMKNNQRNRQHVPGC